MRFFLLVIFFISSFSAEAQTGYKIDLTIKGLKDTTVYLGFYYGESTIIADTARVNSLGAASFVGSKTLVHGAYFLVLDKTRLFEFVISTDQHFSLETSAPDYVRAMVVKGDIDNKLFYDYIFFNIERRKETEPVVKILRDSTLSNENKIDAREAFAKINEKVMAHQNELVDKYPETMTARLVNAMRPIVVPPPPVNPDGSIDSTFQFRYYRDHFFDHLNLKDDATIRLPRPLYQEKLGEYLDKLFIQNPDTLSKEIDRLAAMVKSNKECYKYLVWMCVVKYQNHDIMGLDAIYVHLFDKYFASGEMNFWINEAVKKNLKENADRMRLSLIGKKAPNLVMQDKDLQPKALYDINKKYTLIFFFSPDCGHCRSETPKLVEFYNTNKIKYNFEIYAVDVDTSLLKMNNFIKEMKTPWITVSGPRSYVGPYRDLYDAPTTPTLYIIDARKKIIAKKLPTGQLEDFFEKHEKFMKSQNSGSR